ncbi:MAG TPA: aldehyde dehydrogenase family protein [Solirubrobacteraceae bacterium]|nr:aldehyde dehydrogenase family protein [Solirubrobacteraceae bacterium]
MDTRESSEGDLRAGAPASATAPEASGGAGSVAQEQVWGQGGGQSDAEGSITVENPATGEVIGTVAEIGAQELERMAERGRQAQRPWEALGFEGRGEILRRAQRWVMDNSERIIETIVRETGKTYEDAQFAELLYAANAFGFWAKKAPKYLAEERVSSSQILVKGKKLEISYRPRGLVGVIGPWNYPLTNSFGDCIPALAAGNAVILKPSPFTPFTSLLMAEGMRECGLPEDVLQVATGGAQTGAALIELVDMIMFTGSTRTGRKVAQAAGARLIPCSLELGGKDPIIVLADADVERAANVAAYYSMQNAGQTCISIERAYVEAPVYDEFVRRVAEKIGSLRVGRPEGPGSVEVGAITFPPQLDVIREHVQDAIDKGARVLTGGHERTDSGGRFYEPTVIVDVDHTMKVMREETFGPVLPIMKVRDAEEAIHLANESIYGLGASVFTRDARRGEEIARRIDAGAVDVNDALINYTVLELPMGGHKCSGLGQRHGPAGIRKYCSVQSRVVTARLAPKREPHMFPYKASTSRLLGRLFKLLYGRGRAKAR